MKPSAQAIPPQVAITQPSSGSFVAGSTLEVLANALAAPGRAIIRVEFLRDGLLFATDTSAPYGTELVLPNSGKLTLSAKAFDDNAQNATSEAVAITVVPIDTTPDPFAFSVINNAPLGSVQQSNEVTISGINAAAPISITGGEYQINGGAWTSSAGTITNGQKVRVRLTASSQHETTATAVLSIGGVTGSFAVTTLANNGICGSTPTKLDKADFTGFGNFERLEGRGGRPGNGDWEWGLGANTQRAGFFTQAQQDWVSNREYRYLYSIVGDGSANLKVFNPGNNTSVVNLNYVLDTNRTPMRLGNALKLYVKATGGSGPADVSLSTTMLNGMAAVSAITTIDNNHGNNGMAEDEVFWILPSMSSGMTLEGTLRLNFGGSAPPNGSRLNWLITAGNAACTQAGAQR